MRRGPGRLAAMGPEEFTAVVRGACRWGGKKGWGKIAAGSSPC